MQRYVILAITVAGIVLGALVTFGPLLVGERRGEGLAPVAGPPPPTQAGSDRAARLPEADAEGAQLVGRYCVACHAVPNPTAHTGAQWPGVVERMETLMAAADKPRPTSDEVYEIVRYLAGNGAGNGAGR